LRGAQRGGGRKAFRSQHCLIKPPARLCGELVLQITRFRFAVVCDALQGRAIVHAGACNFPKSENDTVAVSGLSAHAGRARSRKKQQATAECCGLLVISPLLGSPSEPKWGVLQMHRAAAFCAVDAAARAASPGTLRAWRANQIAAGEGRSSGAMN
jgi:hypothetical protein